ncbi:MAG: response regulator transcription factor [Acidobacteriaceae bacterium]|nr:response regulator transcription factor [Acidobacteriaceae bacterium]
MNRIILADNQAIFRAGAARILALEDDMRIVAQCDDLFHLSNTLQASRDAILLFSASMQLDEKAVIASAQAAGIRTILIAENGEEIAEDRLRALDGVIFRNIAGTTLVNCVRSVAAGKHTIQRCNVTSILAQDSVGARVRDRLTPKEMQIVSLIVQGCKNKHIATQLGTKEQVVKNYLRTIYDKTGVSDRLELALFTLHHRILAEAATRASDLLQARSA